MSTNQASSALEFTDALGINVQAGASGAEQNTAAVENALSYLGVPLVRDTFSSTNNAAEFAQFNQDLGIKFDFFIQGGSTAEFTSQLQQVEADPGIVAYVEGPNESDEPGAIQYYDGLSGLPATLAEMQALYASVHADPQLAGVPVIQASFGMLPDYAVYGDQAGTADLANVHIYYGAGNNPGKYDGGTITTLLQDAQTVTPGVPTVVTETGYETLAGSTLAVSPIVQAKYLLDDIFDLWNAGVAATFIYNLVDTGPGAVDSTGYAGYYGLYNANWTPKPAAIALHNLTTLLADPGTGGVTPGTLDYALSGMPSTANSTLLEKSDGTFVLALWNDVDLTGTTVAPVTVTLTLAQPFESITVYDPLTGTTAVQSVANAETVQIMVPDHPVLVEISNTAPVVAGQPAINAPAEILAAPSGIVQVGGVSVGDNSSSTVTVQVTDGAGALGMRDANGLALAGSGTGSITLSGAVATVNAELATLTYTPASPGGDDTISVQVTDAGGAVATDFIPVAPIAWSAWNHSTGPQLGLPSTLNVAIGSSAAVTDVVLTDVFYADNPGLLTMTVSARLGAVSMTVDGVQLAATQSLTVSGSYATVVADLATLTYVAPDTTGADTLSLNVTDAAGLSTSASLSIGIDPALTIDGSDTWQILAGMSGALSGLQIDDVAAAVNADQLQVTIGDTVGTLTMLGGNGTPLPGSGTHAIVLSGTPDQINAALATLMDTAGNTLATDAVTVAVSNAAGQATSRTFSVKVVPPIAIASPGTVAVGSRVIAPVAGISITDSYAASQGLTMTVLVEDTSGVLSMVDAAGNAVAGSGGNAIVLTGALATVNAELATLTYTGPGWTTTDAITIAASDSAGGASTQSIAVPVTPAATLSTYFQVGDINGDPFTRQPVLSSGGMVLTSAATGLAGAVSEQVDSGGTVTLATPAWNVVNAVALVDTQGGSYVLSDFAKVSASLTGGPTAAGQSETLTIDTAQSGSVVLGTGNQNVVINAGLGGASAGSNTTFAITAGSGTENLTVNGYAGYLPSSSYGSLTQASVTAGLGIETMTFLNVHDGVTAGAGNLTIYGSNYGNSITAGTGTVNVWGGTGYDKFTYHAGDGAMTIENFSSIDTLVVDKSLQSAMTETTGSNGLQLQFGSAAHEIVLVGLSSLAPSRITWS
jgi:hypothetical protein